MALTPDDAVVYNEVKEAILRRYNINKETYHQPFRQNRKKREESYQEYADCLAYGSFFSMGQQSVYFVERAGDVGTVPHWGTRGPPNLAMRKETNIVVRLPPCR